MMKIPKQTDNSIICSFSHFIPQVKANQFVDSFEKFRGKSIFLPLDNCKDNFQRNWFVLLSKQYKILKFFSKYLLTLQTNFS